MIHFRLPVILILFCPTPGGVCKMGQGVLTQPRKLRKN
nr:MAG TPA: hypothetical protein [Caudoviricetes sp.]